VKALRLLNAFMVGTCFWLYRDRIRYRGTVAAACAFLAMALMLAPPVAEIALITLGGYVLFWTAFKATWKPLLEINAKDDISYGVYLYAWPVAALIIWYWRDVPVVTLGLLTFVAAVICGAVSWHGLEKHAMRLKRSRKPEALRTAATAQPPTSETA
jgi:peptidoglycan/LPS O-acetylase OafA/YrhL